VRLPLDAAAGAQRRLQIGIGLVRQHGVPWTMRRLGHSARVRGGFYQRSLPVHRWKDRSLPLSESLKNPQDYLSFRRSEPSRFFFSYRDRERVAGALAALDDLPTVVDRADGVFPSPKARAQADAICAGRFRYFSLHEFDRGLAPDWHQEPWKGETSDPYGHWSIVRSAGDVKLLWELSRFSFVFPLVRAFWRTGDEKYAHCFWSLVAGWKEANQPNAGVNWQCGQETSFRLMALAFGLHGFLGAEATTGERLHSAAALLAFSAERIEATLEYALNQHNNHGVSEGVGLLTVGLLFPELSRSAEWSAIGRDVVSSQVSDLVYDDGAFSQHSANYHRVLLDDMLWAQQLCKRAGRPLDQVFDRKLMLATEWLRQMVATAKGQVFNVGRNDGASVLPLSDSWYWDFRPVVQAASIAAGRPSPFGSGRWDEKGLWLGLETMTAPSIDAPPRQTTAHVELWGPGIGGHVIMRHAAAEASVYLRAPASFTHRPSEADPFHVGVSLGGRRVAIDRGTFSYHDDAPWNNPFAAARAHNVATAQKPLMGRAGKFNFLPWPELSCEIVSDAEVSLHHLDARSGDGRSRRVIVLEDGSVVVIDEFKLSRDQPIVLRWTLDAERSWIAGEATKTVDVRSADGLQMSVGCSEAIDVESNLDLDLMRLPREEDPRDWTAVGYRALVPAVWFEVSSAPSREVLFWTVFSTAAIEILRQGKVLRIRSESVAFEHSIGPENRLATD